MDRRNSGRERDLAEADGIIFFDGEEFNTVTTGLNATQPGEKYELKFTCTVGYLFTSNIRPLFAMNRQNHARCG